MPTGGKLIAAVCFAALAFFISGLIIPFLPEGTPVGKFGPINALIGLIMGWVVMGKGAGKKLSQSFGYGLTTLAATVFWCLVVWAGWAMLQNSLRLRYDGPMDALKDMAQLAIDYAKLIAVQAVVIPAVVGALFMAWVTDFFARRWS